MNKYRRMLLILFLLLVVCGIASISIIIGVKKTAPTDYSEESYIYEETELGNEVDAVSEDYTPIEK